MGGRPGVTVVVPTHDRPEPLRRAVQSVIDQTYAGDVEVVVVFDGTEPVLPELSVSAGRTVRAVRNGRAAGPAGARNAGVLAARNDVVAFLDDDDRWRPDKLERQVRVLEGDARSLLVGSAMTVHDGSRRHVRLLPSERITHHDLLGDRLAALHTSSFVARRSDLLGPLGLFDEQLPRGYCEDYDLLLRAASVAPVTVVNEPLVEVAWQGGSHFLGRWSTYAAALQVLVEKHPEFATRRRAIGRLEAQIALALAAAGDRREALRWAGRSLRHDPTRVRAWLALAVAARLTSGDRIVRVARRLGRGL